MGTAHHSNILIFNKVSRTRRREEREGMKNNEGWSNKWLKINKAGRGKRDTDTTVYITNEDGLPFNFQWSLK
jgi:hypothetical protein